MPNKKRVIESNYTNNLNWIGINYLILLMKKFFFKLKFIFAILGEYSLKIKHPLIFLIYPFHIFYYLLYKGYLKKYIIFVIRHFRSKAESIVIIKNRIIKIKNSKTDYIFSGSWSLVKDYKRKDKCNEFEIDIIYFDHPWWNNYWHFMLEALPLLFIISNSFNDKFRKIYLKENNFWYQVSPFFIDLGIDSEIIFVKSKNEIKENCLYKFLQFPGGGYPHPELVNVAKDISNNLLKLAIQKKYLNKDFKGIKNIFLIRDQARRNTEINQAVKEFAQTNDFEIYNSSNIKFIWDGLQLFSKAQRIIVPHGAGLVNMLTASKECEIVELYSPLYSNIVSLCLANYLNIKLEKVAIWPSLYQLLKFQNLSPLGRIENDLKVDLRDLHKVFKKFF